MFMLYEIQLKVSLIAVHNLHPADLFIYLSLFISSPLIRLYKNPINYYILLTLSVRLFFFSVLRTFSTQYHTLTIRWSKK